MYDLVDFPPVMNLAAKFSLYPCCCGLLSWYRVFLQKVLITQLFKKFSKVYYHCHESLLLDYIICCSNTVHTFLI
jgi:hypothetical protein